MLTLPCALLPETDRGYGTSSPDCSRRIRNAWCGLFGFDPSRMSTVTSMASVDGPRTTGPGAGALSEKLRGQRISLPRVPEDGTYLADAPVARDVTPPFLKDHNDAASALAARSRSGERTERRIVVKVLDGSVVVVVVVMELGALELGVGNVVVWVRGADWLGIGGQCGEARTVAASRWPRSMHSNSASHIRDEVAGWRCFRVSL